MNTTLDEWEILQAVVQAGGFAPAAQQLNRSQSTVSYAIARLQEKLGIQLFELKGRKAHLTEMGRALLAEAEPHLAGFEQMEQKAQSLASGGESEVRLSVDSIFPNSHLFAALTEFSRRFPYVHSTLRQSTFLSPDREFSAHNAHLCISALPAREYFAQPIFEVRLLAVARWDHPLHALKRRLSRADILQHTLANIEAVVSGVTRRQPLASAQRHIPLNSIEAAVDAVRCGLCFGWLPAYRIQSQLDSGELLPLRMAAGGERQVRLNLICRDPNSNSREVAALAELLGMNGEIQRI